MAASWQESCNKPRQYVKKERHQLADKVHIVNPTFFPVLTYSCESWNTKKAEKQRIDAFELWCWESVGQQRSNQSILKAINPEYSLEGLMLKLKLQYFGHLMWRPYSLEKTLMPGEIEGRRRRGDRGWDSWRASLTKWTDEFVQTLGDSEGQGSLLCFSPWGHEQLAVTKWLKDNNKNCKDLNRHSTKKNIQWSINMWNSA